MLKEYIVDLACETAIQKFGDKINRERLKHIVDEFVMKQKKFHEVALLNDEIDYQGLFEFIKSGYIDLVIERCFCVNRTQRAGARDELVSRACSYCDANTEEARKRLAQVIYTTIDIIKNFYKTEFNIKDYLVAEEIVDGVIDAMDEKLEPIQHEMGEVKASISSLNFYSPEAYAKLARERNLSEIESRFDNIFLYMNKEHPLYPDYGYKMVGKDLLSCPLTSDAEKKYPPRYLCNGNLYIGEQMISREDASDMDIIDYADRHQLQLKLEICDVTKMLGEVTDPQQVEAERMEGKVIVRKPKEFPPSFACSISLNHEVMFDYIELRTKEILDDGTYVIDNSEQKESHIYIMLKTIMAVEGKVDFTLKIDRASNIELYQYVRFMKLALEGAEVEVNLLSNRKTLCSGFINTATYHSGFPSIDEELRFLKDVCAVEKYVGFDVKVPKEITEKEINELSYLAGLVHGEEQTFSWKELSMKGIIDDNFRRRIIQMNSCEHELAFVGNQEVSLFEHTINIPLVRRFDHAMVSDLDKIKRKLEVLDNGDEIGLSFVCKGEGSGADFLNPDSEYNSDNEYVGCFTKNVEGE